MKFSCNRCNTKYSLPDEKFAGKVITLTCKRCGAKIVVKPERQTPSEKITEEKSRQLSSNRNRPLIQRRTEKKIVSEEMAVPKNIESERSAETKKIGQSEVLRQQKRSVATEAHTKAGKQAPQPDEKTKEGKRSEEKRFLEDRDESSIEKREEREKEEEATWYYSRGGEQKGPFTDTEIQELVESNVITPKTFVWKDGMMDWMRAGRCREFSRFLSVEPILEKKEKNAVEALRLDEVNKKYRTDPAAESSSESSNPHLQEEFFNKEVVDRAVESHDEEVDWSRLPSSEDTEVPRENTRIFIMRAGLSESAKRRRMLLRAVIATILIGVFIFVFLKNLNPILSAVGIKMRTGIDLEMEDLDKDTLSSMTPEERERYRKALLGIKESKNLSKEQKKSLAMAIKQKKDSDISNLLFNTKVEGNAVIYENLGRERLQGNFASGANLDLEGKLANTGTTTKIEGVDLSSKINREEIDLTSRLPDRVDNLNESIIMAIVNKNRGSLKYCYERHLKASSSLEGKVVFKITIQNSGQVGKVESLSNKIAGSLFEECILKELKKWTFPKFRGEPIVFEVPFVLTTIN